MTERVHEPIRTCVGCRERYPQDSLIRLGLRRGKVVIISEKSEVAGRTIYLCPREDCWQRATRHNRLAFKTSKYDRITVYLDTKERDALLMRLRRFSRDRGLQD